MVRKPTSSAPPPASDDSAAASARSDSPPGAEHNVWLAGLGALSNAQAEGSKAFEALVKQGLDMQNRAQELARERMQAMAESGAGATPWNRLGGIFEDRVARALSSMGMPSAQDLAALTARVEALEHALAQRTPAPAATTPARKTRATPGKTR